MTGSTGMDGRYGLGSHPAGYIGGAPKPPQTFQGYSPAGAQQPQQAAAPPGPPGAPQPPQPPASSQQFQGFQPAAGQPAPGAAERTFIVDMPRAE